MKKQTAVKWLVEKLNQCEPMYSGIQSNEHKEYLDTLIEQAKEMEKQQIKDAHLIGLITSMEMEATKQSEQYYNETYKNS